MDLSPDWSTVAIYLAQMTAHIPMM